MKTPQAATRRWRATLGLMAIAWAIIPVLWIWPQRGLTATYHANTNWLDSPILTRIETRLTTETVEENAGTMPQQQFSILMVGAIRADVAGEYTFSTRSDDGSTLDVANSRVVDNGGYHVARTASGRIALEPGFHPIRLRYIQGSGGYSLNVRWIPPGGEESAIPPGVLYVSTPTLPSVAMLARYALPMWIGASISLIGLLFFAMLRKTRARGQWRLAVARGLLVVGSMLFTLIMIELAMRVVSFTREDRRSLNERLSETRADGTGLRIYSLGDLVQPSANEGIVYELKPNLSGAFQNQPLATNAQGLRDRDYAFEKPAGTVRIVALGDSSLFGWGVRVEDSTTEVLEQMLRERKEGPPVEVINFATPGYNTAIEAEVFISKALRYNPDIVLVNFNTNDYDIPAFMRLPQDFATLRRLFLFDFVYSRYEAITGKPTRELPVFDFTNRTLNLLEADRLDEDPNLPDEYRYMVGVRGFERAIDRIVTAARQNGVRMVVFDTRSYPGLHPTYEFSAFRDGQRQLLERLSREKGFYWLNTYPQYVKYLQENPTAPFPQVFSVSSTDSHPSVVAHRISAQAIRDFLVDNRLLVAK